MTIEDHPISHVQWIEIDRIEANDYNPNSVASQEMKLLYLSIKSDGMTQPIVTFWDAEKGKYVIIDGFHRYTTFRLNPDLHEPTGGKVACVVIDKPIEERMASTVRHNRARGKHSVEGMSNMVFEMLEHGMSDADICNAMGMEPEELVRLKHITGFAKLFDKVEYTRAWETGSQIKHRKAQEAKEQEAEK